MLGRGPARARRRSSAASNVKPWVKTSLAPGSQVVTDYLDEAGLLAVPRDARLPPRRLRLHDLHRQQRPAARRRSRRRSTTSDLVVAAVLSRQPQLRGPHQPAGARELPRVAAAGGRLRARRHAWTSTSTTEPLGTGSDGKPVFLRDIWPTQREVARGRARRASTPELFRRSYADVFDGRRALARAAGARRATSSRGTPQSTYVKQPPFFDGMPREPPAPSTTSPARACWRCSATGHDRPHLARRLDRDGQPRRAST